MSGTQLKVPGEWRNFGKRVPITACYLKRDGLKLLYRLVDEGQKEYRLKISAIQVQQAHESLEEFNKRREMVHNAFVTSVTISARNGQLLTGNNENIFDLVDFPSDLRSVFYSTRSVPEAVLKHIPEDRITVFLDFSKPPALDLTKLPTLPTPNESNFEVSATNQAWFALNASRLTQFFQERKSSYEYIHKAGAYDLLLLILGLPLSVWACAKIEKLLPEIDQMATIPRSLIYFCVFMLALTAFRVVFSYSRWVFPKVEIEGSGNRTVLRHRAIWIAVTSAVVGPAFYDLVKAAILALLK